MLHRYHFYAGLVSSMHHNLEAAVFLHAMQHPFVVFCSLALWDFATSKLGWWVLQLCGISDRSADLTFFACGVFLFSRPFIGIWDAMC
jgi:hypothetical protein